MAFSAFFEICLTIIRATRRPKMSPTTIPSTPPSGFFKDVIWPNRNPCRTSPGTHQFAKVYATLNNNSESVSLSRIGRNDLLSFPARRACPSCSAEFRRVLGRLTDFLVEVGGDLPEVHEGWCWSEGGPVRIPTRCQTRQRQARGWVFRPALRKQCQQVRQRFGGSCWSNPMLFRKLT